MARVSIRIWNGKCSPRPKYNLEPVYTAIFPCREEWIRGPKAPTEDQGLVYFKDCSWTEKGTEVGIYGPKTRPFFALGKEICKRSLCKEESLPTVGSAGATWRADPLPRTLKEVDY
jgi:hypothetical protein